MKNAIQSIENGSIEEASSPRQGRVAGGFSEETVREIGKIIEISDPPQLARLRHLLFGAADDLRSAIDFAGGTSTERQAQEWRGRTIKHAKSLLNDLSNAELFLRGSTTVTDRKLQIIPASDFASSIADTVHSVEGLCKRLEGFDDAGSSSKDSETKQTIIRQMLVDNLTRVFEYFVGREAIVRVTGGSATYGMFTDFIRASANPCLKALLNEQDELKLDTQIQKAIRKFNRKI